LPTSLQVVTLALRMGENPALAGLKHCNRLEQIMGRLELRHTGAFEGIMASSAGLLISGTMSNVFVEVDGELVTPAVDRCGVAGVLRAAVLRQAATLGISVRVAALPIEATAHCTAMALSNARMGLVNVGQLDGRPLRASADLQRLATAVAQ
jgi:4-amino-4-deoxychorismate lyase